MMEQKGSGRENREGISLTELADMFPDEAAATAWFKSLVWPEGCRCPRCGNTETTEAAATAGLIYWCGACRKGFSVSIGTVLEKSKVPLRKWAFAVYLDMTSLKGISNMKLHRDLKVTQKMAWFMLRRIRKAWGGEAQAPFPAPVEGGDRGISGRKKSKRAGKKTCAGKAAVAGFRNRGSKRVSTAAAEATDQPALRSFVADRTAPGTVVCTDEDRACPGMSLRHETANRSVGKHVRGQERANGMESFRSLLKRGCRSIFRHLNTDRLDQYVRKVAGRHEVRDEDKIRQMESVVTDLVGNRLIYRDLTADIRRPA